MRNHMHAVSAASALEQRSICNEIVELTWEVSKNHASSAAGDSQMLLSWCSRSERKQFWRRKAVQFIGCGVQTVRRIYTQAV